MDRDVVQLVRLVDVFVLGPVMIAAARRSPFSSNALNGFLLLSGVATIAFNGIRFMQQSP